MRTVEDVLHAIVDRISWGADTAEDAEMRKRAHDAIDGTANADEQPQPASTVDSPSATEAAATPPADAQAPSGGSSSGSGVQPAG